MPRDQILTREGKIMRLRNYPHYLMLLLTTLLVFIDERDDQLIRVKV